VMELRPRGAWHKGTAARRLLGAMPRGCACLYAGDDLSDEDAFRSLADRDRALTFKVGRGGAAMAQGTRRDLGRLLDAILQTLDGRD